MAREADHAVYRHLTQRKERLESELGLYPPYAPSRPLPPPPGRQIKPPTYVPPAMEEKALAGISDANSQQRRLRESYRRSRLIELGLHNGIGSAPCHRLRSALNHSYQIFRRDPRLGSLHEETMGDIQYQLQRELQLRCSR